MEKKVKGFWHGQRRFGSGRRTKTKGGTKRKLRSYANKREGEIKYSIPANILQ